MTLDLRASKAHTSISMTYNVKMKTGEEYVFVGERYYEEIVALDFDNTMTKLTIDEITPPTNTPADNARFVGTTTIT